jgi:hypothetical protein
MSTRPTFVLEFNTIVSVVRPLASGDFLHQAGERLRRGYPVRFELDLLVMFLAFE